MLDTIARPAFARQQLVTVTVFGVFYGQHLIGLARARGAEEAMHVIEALFLGDIEPERMNARSATADEEVTFSASLPEPGEDTIIGIIV